MRTTLAQLLTFNTPHLRRHRKWLVLAVVVLLYLLGRLLYDALLPAHTWLDRAWFAMHTGHYAEAERCIRHAKARDPHSDLPDIAAYACAWHNDKNDPSPISRFGVFVKLPLIGEWLQGLDQEQVKSRRDTDPSLHSFHKRYAYWSVPCDLFWKYWTIYPNEVKTALLIMHAVEQQHYGWAWQQLAQLQQQHPQAYAAFFGSSPLNCSSPLLYRYYEQAAWHTGHLNELTNAAYRMQVAAIDFGEYANEPKLETLYTVTNRDVEHALLHNAALGILPGASVKTWSSRHGVLTSVFSDNIRFDGDAPVLAPGRRFPSVLISLPSAQAPSQQAPLWWQWTGDDWQAAPPVYQRAYADFLDTAMLHVPQTEVWYAHSLQAEYLSLRSSNNDATRGRILVIGKDVSTISGHSPYEIAWCNGDLWIHEAMGFTRLGADGIGTEYRGHEVMREGHFFSEPETLPPSPLALDNNWRLATDGAGRLWLVSWDGISLQLRAVWTGSAFRPATAEEQQQAAQGFVDAAGRLWLTADLPKGFCRDAWRTVPRLPKMTDAAHYAVDGKGRVWVICGGVVARWDGAWHSAANRLPGFVVQCKGIVAAGNGVLVVYNERVAYLE